jgi:hypothetical protein
MQTLSPLENPQCPSGTPPASENLAPGSKELGQKPCLLSEEPATETASCPGLDSNRNVNLSWYEVWYEFENAVYMFGIDARSGAEAEKRLAALKATAVLTHGTLGLGRHIVKTV